MRLFPLPALLALTGCLGEGPYIKRELQKNFEDHAIHRRVDFEKLYVEPAKVEISGLVEVPLVTLDPADRRAFVEVVTADPKGGENKTWVFAVDPGEAAIQVTDELAKALGAEPQDRRLGGLQAESVVALDGFAVQGLRFLDVQAFAGYKGKSGAYTVDGVIGLGAFPSLAGAVLSSEGKLLLAPAEQGDALLARVSGGVTLPYRSLPAQKVEHVTAAGKLKWVSNPYSLVVDMQVGGQSARTALLLRGSSGHLSPKAGVIARGFSSAPAISSAGASRILATTASLDSKQSFDLLLEEVPGESYDATPLDAALDLGDLGAWDLAWSPQSRTLVLAISSSQDEIGQRRPSSSPVLDRLIQEAMKGLEPNPETGEAPKPEAVAGAQMALADLYARAPGQGDKVLAAYAAASSATPDDCSITFGQGSWLVEQGRYAEAVPALSKSAELYGPWAALPKAERDQIKEDKAKAEKKEGGVWEGPKPQAHACFAAWGLLAEAALAEGDHARVASLYAEHQGMDRHLSEVAAASLLLQGRLTEAEAALRQASRVAGPGAVDIASGLAVAYARQGRDEQALEALERAVTSPPSGLMEARLYARLAVSTRGAEAALKDLQQRSEAAPALLQLRLAWIELSMTQGKDQDAALAQVLKDLERSLALGNTKADILSAYAFALSLDDKTEEASKVARLALEVDPRDTVALLLLIEAGDKSLQDRALKAAIGSPAAMALIAEGDGV